MFEHFGPMDRRIHKEAEERLENEKRARDKEYFAKFNERLWKSGKCFYCDKNDATTERVFDIHRVFATEQKREVTYTETKKQYLRAQIKVPYCKRCERLHTMKSFLTVLINIIVVGGAALIGYFFLRDVIADNTCLLIIILLAGAAAILVGLNMLLDRLTSSIFYRLDVREDPESFTRASGWGDLSLNGWKIGAIPGKEE